MNDPDFIASAVGAGKLKAKKLLLVFKIIGVLFAIGGLALGVPALIASNWWNVFWGALLLLLGLPTLGATFYFEAKLNKFSDFITTANHLKKQFDQQSKF